MCAQNGKIVNANPPGRTGGGANIGAWGEADRLWKGFPNRSRQAAKKRQGTRTDQLPGKLPESRKGDARDKVAAFTGIAARTLDKAAELVAAAEAGQRHGAIGVGYRD